MVAEQPPPHWNSYRPSYRPSYDDDYQGFSSRGRSTSVSTRGRRARSPSRRPTEYSDAHYGNPNNIPVRPRHDHRSPSREEDRDEGPQLWDAKLNSLIHRTLRAYDLVTNYVRDCPDGKRWSREDIRHVRSTGAKLHDDVRILRSWKITVRQYGDRDEDMMGKIHQDVEKVRVLCEQVQRVILETEHEVRDGVGKAADGKVNEVEMEDGGYTGANARAVTRTGRDGQDHTEGSGEFEMTLRIRYPASSAPAPAPALSNLNDASAEPVDAVSEPTSTDLVMMETPKSSPELDPIDAALSADWASMTSTAKPGRFVW
ncbi:hypothetical protein FB567DRAFT_609296 [Paraphoma chrysanthemicola]|uniref:Uncharacterized protein n=1 Tax=Paraphoma chrysanthemicola TaxID=798071 RepID=A0A8K0REA7_9PLEO|nr:hypothetical protein FB567DRAFT_609296 [Paraphoma chrysanthemicola]